MSKSRRIRVGAAVALSITFAMPFTAKADYDYHSIFYYRTNYYDSFQYVSTGTVSAPNIVNAFTAVEQWRADVSTLNYWTEIGWTAGTVNTRPWVGFFGAYNEPAINGQNYHEFTIGLQNDTSVSNSGLYAWSGTTVAFVYNGRPVNYVNTGSRYSNEMQTGIESRSPYPSFNLFVNGTIPVRCRRLAEDRSGTRGR